MNPWSSLPKARAAELELSREEELGSMLSLLEGNSPFPTCIFPSVAVSPQKGLEKGLLSEAYDPGWKSHQEYPLAAGFSRAPGAQGQQGWFSCSLLEQQALPTAPYTQLAVAERLYPAPADTPWAGLEAQTTGQGHPVTLLCNLGFFFFPALLC